MTQYIDLIGRQFGRTVVVARFANTSTGRTRWMCNCNCGKAHITSGDNLRSGRTQSCGCLHIELVGDQHRTHGMSSTSTYRSWSGLKERCTNPNNLHFKYYGGSGLTYDPKWETFEGFLSDMGEAPKGLSIDRIDNNAGYTKENCQWATARTQSRNRRCVSLSLDDASIMLTMRHAKVPQMRIARMFNISVSTVKDIEHKRTWIESTRLPL